MLFTINYYYIILHSTILFYTVSCWSRDSIVFQCLYESAYSSTYSSTHQSGVTLQYTLNALTA